MPALAEFLANAFGAQWEFTGPLAVELHADGLDELRGGVHTATGISNEPAKAQQTLLERARTTFQPRSATDVEVAIWLEPGEDLHSRIMPNLKSTDPADVLAEHGPAHPNTERFSFGDLRVKVMRMPSARQQLAPEKLSTTVAGFPVTPLVRLNSSMAGDDADVSRGEETRQLLEDLMMETIAIVSQGGLLVLPRTAPTVRRRFGFTDAGNAQQGQQPEEAGPSHPTGHGLSHRKRSGPEPVEAPSTTRQRDEGSPVAHAPERAAPGEVTTPRGARLTEAQREHLQRVSRFEAMPELAEFLKRQLGLRWAVTGSVAVRLHADRLGMSDSPLNRRATDVDVVCLDKNSWDNFPHALSANRPGTALGHSDSKEAACFDFETGMTVGVMPANPARSALVENPVTIGGIPVMPLATLERFKVSACTAAQDSGNEALLKLFKSDLELIRELRRLDEAAAPQQQG